MPGIGGRLGWNEPPPAAMTTILALEFGALVGLHAKQRIADLLDGLHHLVEMDIARLNGLICCSSASTSPCALVMGNAGNVVDRLLRIELGALAADLVENVDEMALHVEQAKLEHREQADRPRADDENVGLDRFAHVVSKLGSDL